MAPPILGELLAVLGASIVVVALCQRLHIPSLVGFLITGALIGPGVLGLVEDHETIEVLAEIGVVLLLFSIGLEFSLREFARMRSVVLGAGGGQVLATIAITTGVALVVGASLREAVFTGFLLALSSTALVLTLLTQRGELHSLHGRVSLGILIFQDLAIVPLMLITPLIAGVGATLLDALRQLGIAVVVVVATLVLAARLFPRALDLVARTRNRELFTIFTVTAALGTAYLTGLAGLSLALGAFLAGLIISDSDYGARVHSEVMPFQYVFKSIFFISVGMLVDPAVWVERPGYLLGGVVAVLVGKALITGVVLMLAGFGLRIAVMGSLTLAQIGEFSFILAHLGLEQGLMPERGYALMISVTVATMMLTPVTMSLAGPVAARVEEVAWLRRFLRDAGAEPPDTDELHDHVVICGYGLTGRKVARVLARLGVSYVIVELNPQLVRKAAESGEQVLFGDATRQPILEHVRVDRARAVVITVADRAAARHICGLSRGLNAEALLIVRTRYVADAPDLRELGADEIVPEEFETSLELVARVMAAYGATESAVFLEKQQIRREGYALLMGHRPATEMPTLRQILATADVATVEVEAGSRAAGATVASLALPRAHRVTILAIERGGESQVTPPADYQLCPGDRVFVFGTPGALESARPVFAAPA